MFVASRVYNYATGASPAAADPDATPANTRVKRHPRRQQAASPAYASAAPGASSDGRSGVAPDQKKASYADTAAAAAAAAAAGAGAKATNQSKAQRTAAELAKIAAIDEIVAKEDLYEVLGVKRTAKSEEIRRGFLNRSRVCHPDKLPNYAPCVVAFQKVSFAYQTLSKPSSRRMYDVSGRSDLAAALNEQSASSANGFDPTSGMASDETLNGVLYSVFCEFLEGDFEMIRVLVNALNEGNPGLNLGEEAVDSIEGAFRKLRELMMAGKKYLTVIRFELIRLYEIQHSLRQLSYFDVFGRIRLTLQLARVTLSIPMAIDQAMKEPEATAEATDESYGAEGKKAAGNESEDEWSERESDSNDEETVAEDFRAAHNQQSVHHERRRQRRRRKPSVEDFGIRADEEDEANEAADGTRLGFEAADDEPTGIFGTTTNHEHARTAARKARRQARIEERRRAKLEAKEAQTLRKRGLLGPTASGLLKGVVKVLETSESWVPGGTKNGTEPLNDVDEKLST